MVFAALTRGLLAAAVLMVAASNGRAQSVADFYKGKTVDLYIGYSVGGAYDLYARQLARHMGKHIPGNPTVLPKNMEGAGSLRLANWLYNVGPKDGTAFGIIGRGTGFDPLLGNKAAQFDATKFTWIGSANNEVSICVAWNTSGITKFEDMLTKELIVGGTSTSADTDQFPRITNGVLGTKMKIVTGYPGGNEVGLAMERGEVQGRCGWSWSSVKSTHQKWLDEKKFTILVQLALDKHPGSAGRAAHHRSRQDRRAAANPEADLRAPGDGPPVRRTAQHSGRPRRGAAQRLHGDDEGQGFPRRHREGADGDHAGPGRQGPGTGQGDLFHAAGNRAEGGFLSAIESRNNYRNQMDAKVPNYTGWQSDVIVD